MYCYNFSDVSKGKQYGNLVTLVHSILSSCPRSTGTPAVGILCYKPGSVWFSFGQDWFECYCAFWHTHQCILSIFSVLQPIDKPKPTVDMYPRPRRSLSQMCPMSGKVTLAQTNPNGDEW